MSDDNINNKFPLTEKNISEVEKQLQKILSSSHFKHAKRMRQFLSYVVSKVIEGKESSVKQYSIAVDALGFPDDFDADTNPAVRIMASRLRERLEKFYKEDGKEDRVIIHLSKGNYTPRFEYRHKGSSETSSNTSISTQRKSPNKLWHFLMFFAVVVAGLGLTTIVLNKTDVLTNNKNQAEDFSQSLPLVDVMPFDNLTGIDRGRMLTKGIRYQFISELSQFNMIRVRDIPEVDDIDPKQLKRLKKSNYSIKGALLEKANQLQLTILLQDNKSSEILWSKEVTVPANDDGFNKLIFEGVKGVMTKVAGTSGVMQLEAMKHLRNRLNQGKTGILSSYECVLLFYDYDNTKDPKTEDAARKCLKRFTQKEVNSSMLWATHGLMMLLDWTKNKDTSDDTLYNLALASLKKAINLDPNNALAYEYYGNYFMVKERNEEAGKAYEKAVKLNPSNPNILVSIGWIKVNKGDWENGIKEIKQAVDVSYRPPAWFRVPLAVDAFRRNSFKESLHQAEIIFESGDKRGIALSLAAAIKLDKSDLINQYANSYIAYRKDDLEDPLREVGTVLKVPEVLKRYNETIKPVIESLTNK